LEAKYEKTRKSLKEVEATYNKQLSQLEKERNSIQEKFLGLETRKVELEARLTQELSVISQNNQQLRDNLQGERRALGMEIEKYKSLYLQNEQEKSEMVMNYDRDKVKKIKENIVDNFF
jgi:hypothetical protein